MPSPRRPSRTTLSLLLAMAVAIALPTAIPAGGQPPAAPQMLWEVVLGHLRAFLLPPRATKAGLTPPLSPAPPPQAPLAPAPPVVQSDSHGTMDPNG